MIFEWICLQKECLILHICLRSSGVCVTEASEISTIESAIWIQPQISP